MYYQLYIDNSLILDGDLRFVILGIVTILTIVVSLLFIILHIIQGSEKMKYEFITIIAHKFRTPLTQIKWLVEGLYQTEVDSYKKQSLSEVGMSNDRLIKMTNALIEAVESEERGKTAYTFEKLNINALIKELGSQLKNSFHEKNIFFAVQVPEEQIYIKGDRARVEYIIETLLENARDYTPTGKNVDVIVESSFNTVSVIVIDKGIGILTNDISKIGTKFFRSDIAKSMNTEGMGISLFLAKSVIRRHKAKLEYSSQGENEGSIFKVTFKTVMV